MAGLFGNNTSALSPLISGALSNIRGSRDKYEALKLQKMQQNPWTALHKKRNPLVGALMGTAENYFNPETQEKVKMAKAANTMKEWMQSNNIDPVKDRDKILEQTMKVATEFELPTLREKAYQTMVAEKSAAAASKRAAAESESKIIKEGSEALKNTAQGNLYTAQAGTEPAKAEKAKAEAAKALAQGRKADSDVILNDAKVQEVAATMGLKDDRAALLRQKARDLRNGKDIRKSLKKDETMMLVATGDAAVIKSLYPGIELSQDTIARMAKDAATQLSYNAKTPPKLPGVTDAQIKASAQEYLINKGNTEYKGYENTPDTMEVDSNRDFDDPSLYNLLWSRAKEIIGKSNNTMDMQDALDKAYGEITDEKDFSGATFEELWDLAG